MTRPTRTLYVSVETTGRYNFREAVNDPSQPHLARLSWLIATDDDEDDGLSWSRLIKPRPGWEYEESAIEAHHITPAMAASMGVSLETAMTTFVGTLEQVDRLVAFNLDFVRKVLEHAAWECGLNWEYLLTEVPLSCVMRESTDIVRIPRMQPGGGWAWPKFRDAYEFFTNNDQLPSPNMDPEERGLALCACVMLIDVGIRDYRQATDPNQSDTGVPRYE